MITNSEVGVSKVHTALEYGFVNFLWVQFSFVSVTPLGDISTL